MTVSVVQIEIETVDDFNADDQMTATYDANPTVGNVSLALNVIVTAARTITGVTGCGTYAQIEAVAGLTGSPNASLYSGAAAAVNTTAAQVYTASAASGSTADIAILLEASGIDTSNIESGTSVTNQVNPGSNTHNGGSITPSTENTLYVALWAFNANPGVITGDVTAANGWTLFTTGDNTRYGGYKVINGSSAAVTANINSGTARTSASIFLALRGTAASPPVVDDVNGDDEVEYNSAGNVSNGSNYSSATVEIEQDDGPVAQTVTAQDATSITFTNVFDTGSPQLKFGTATFRAINGDAQQAELAINLVTDAASAYVDLASVNPVSDYRITAIPDLEVGFQLQYGNVQGGTIADVTVFNDATFAVDPAVTAFDVRAWDVNTAEWGAWATQQAQQEFTTATGLARDNRRRGMLNMIWGRG